MTLGQQRRSFPVIRVGTLQWATGAFCLLIGALMLVTPHQFDGPSYSVLRPRLPWWGAAFLLAGAGLLDVAALAPRRGWTIAAHLFAGAGLLVLSSGFLVAGGWTGVAVYTTLGLGVILGAFLPQPRPGTESSSSDLFVLVMSTGAVINGVFLLGFPDQFSSPIYNAIRADLRWYGLAFLGGALAVLLKELRPSTSRAVAVIAHLLLAVAFFAWMAASAIPNRIWTGIAYYGSFGTLLALLPWLSPRVRRVDSASLRTRLALALATVGAPPLIAAAALAAEYEQRQATAEALMRQQSLAVALSQSVGDYIGLHRAALAALAGQPGLSELGPEAQRELLRTVARAYTDFYVLTTHDADGNPIARSDILPPVPAAGDAVFEDARRTRVPSVEVLISPSISRPSFVFGAPIRGLDGAFAGAVGGGLEAERLATILVRASIGDNVEAYVVDGNGRLIAHPDSSLVTGSAERAGVPPVATLLRRRDPAGSLSYAGRAGEWLAGYAYVPELGWGVVVERPAALALATVYAGRDLAFGVLLLVIVVGAVIGALTAGRLAAPLGSLARAAEQLAAGNASAPLPRSRITEVARLTRAFGEMRDRLARRTAQRERAEQAQRFLAETSTLLAASLDYETTMQSVARAAVPYLADLCVFDVIRDDGTIRRVAAAHADPAKQSLADGLLHYPPPPDGAYNTPAVLRDGRPRLIADIDDAYLAGAARDTEHLRIIRALEPKSSIVVPLLIRDRTLGSIQLVATETRRAYDMADLALAEELARRAAAAVENARLYRESQEAVRARDEFLSIASHELRTPVAGIKGHAQMLLRAHARGRLDAERLERSIGAIGGAADRLTTLTLDLLDVSRIRLGELPLRPQPLDLATLVDEVTARFGEQLDERHTLAVDADRPCQVSADPARLEQVLANLLDNAVKFSPSGGEVCVLLRREDGSAALAVRDQGIGLPPDAAEGIFRPFGRARNAARENLPGMGLGLYISRDIVERHGGEIWAESDGEGRGTTMCVRLPVDIGPDRAAARNLTPPVPAADDGGHH